MERIDINSISEAAFRLRIKKERDRCTRDMIAAGSILLKKCDTDEQRAEVRKMIDELRELL